MVLNFFYYADNDLEFIHKPLEISHLLTFFILKSFPVIQFHRRIKSIHRDHQVRNRMKITSIQQSLVRKSHPSNMKFVNSILTSLNPFKASSSSVQQDARSQHDYEVESQFKEFLRLDLINVPKTFRDWYTKLPPPGKSSSNHRFRLVSVSPTSDVMRWMSIFFSDPTPPSSAVDDDHDKNAENGTDAKNTIAINAKNNLITFQSSALPASYFTWREEFKIAYDKWSIEEWDDDGSDEWSDKGGMFLPEDKVNEDVTNIVEGCLIACWLVLVHEIDRVEFCVGGLTVFDFRPPDDVLDALREVRNFVVWRYNRN